MTVVEKEYDLNSNSNPYPHLYTTADYYETIVTKIRRESILLRMTTNLDIIIFCGSDILSALVHCNSYVSKSNYNSFDGVEFVGYLFGDKVYYDINLGYNTVLIGTDYNEIKYYNIKKERKEKLKKIKRYEI